MPRVTLWPATAAPPSRNSFTEPDCVPCPAGKFTWNHHLLKPLREAGALGFGVAVVQGFVGQISENLAAGSKVRLAIRHDPWARWDELGRS